MLVQYSLVGIVNFRLKIQFFSNAQSTTFTRSMQRINPLYFLNLLTVFFSLGSLDSKAIDNPEFSSSVCWTMDQNGNNTGAIKYVVSGSPPPYTIVWRELGSATDLGMTTLTNSSDSFNITGLDLASAVDYEVVITDFAGSVACQDTFMFNQINQLVGSITLESEPVCNGDNNAQASTVILSVPDPVAEGYTFLWSSGETTRNANNLSGGANTLTVTSPEGCILPLGIAIPDPPLLVVDMPVTVSPSCPGGDNGSIALTITGGRPSTGAFPYTIQWSTGLGDLNANPLTNANNPITAGRYSATVTDAPTANNNVCEVIVTDIIIVDPASVTTSIVNDMATTCSRGACDGQAEVIPIGGMDPSAGYTFLWENGESTATAATLCSGWNVVGVSNAGCPPVLDSIMITAANDVTVAVLDSTDASCFNSADGGVTVLANGGMAAYTYSWDDGGSGDSRNNLDIGTYTVSVVDANGCESLNRSVSITEPDSMEVVIDLGGSLNPRCHDTENGIMSVRWIRGGNMNTTPMYTWSNNVPNPPDNPVALNLPPGIYSVTVTDGNGCTDEVTHTLTSPPPLIGRMAMPAEPDCFGDLAIVTVDSAVGGTGTSFTFSVDNGPQQQLGNPNAVLAGTHIVTVFDRNSCRWDTTIVIDQPDQVVVNLVDEITVNLGDSAQLMPNVPGSIMIDQIIWTPTGDLTCDDCLNPWVIPTRSANYEVTIVDFNGCSGSDIVEVILNRQRNVYIPNAFSPNNDGINDFFQLVTGTGVNRVNYLRVFDRYGSLLYAQENFLPGGGTDGWNGEHKGRDLNMGTFVYVAEVLFQDNTTLVYRGGFNLVR